MSTPRVRDFHADDLDQVVRIWEESRSLERRAVYGLAEVLGALRDEGAAVVAAVGEGVVGAAAGRLRGGRGWGGLLGPWDEWRGGGPWGATLEGVRERGKARGGRPL